MIFFLKNFNIFVIFCNNCNIFFENESLQILKILKILFHVTLYIVYKIKSFISEII